MFAGSVHVYWAPRRLQFSAPTFVELLFRGGNKCLVNKQQCLLLFCKQNNGKEYGRRPPGALRVMLKNGEKWLGLEMGRSVGLSRTLIQCLRPCDSSCAPCLLEITDRRPQSFLSEELQRQRPGSLRFKKLQKEFTIPKERADTSKVFTCLACPSRS